MTRNALDALKSQLKECLKIQVFERKTQVLLFPTETSSNHWIALISEMWLFRFR